MTIRAGHVVFNFSTTTTFPAQASVLMLSRATDYFCI